MSSTGRTTGHFNAINRDLTILIVIAFVAAIAIVTMGVVVINQF